jgi:hypothetical protein
MNWKFWEKAESFDLPDNIRTAMVSRFGIETALVNRIKCAQKQSTSSSALRHIRLFDPTMMDSSVKPAKSYDDLKRHKKSILFEGRVNKETGEIYLSDRRPLTKRIAQASNSAMTGNASAAV